ncbi:MAG: hypothetical protein Q8M11_22910 [Sulfuritalea sp.]|nr:hypothetical protein [Sulfuritalea sp.]
MLIALIALLAMGGLYFFISNLTPEAIESRRQAKTDAAMLLAREALIGYALKYRDEEAGQGRLDRMYGYLPLPDLGSDRNNNVNCTEEGCDANTPTDIVCNPPDPNNIYPTMVGRLPWRTLGTGPLRDGHGECLWLIVSSLHLRKQCSNPVLPPMNWDTLGQLDIVTANGTNALTSALAVHDRPVAIIFSPGPPLPGQDRSNPGGPNVSECGGNYNVANYLDPAVATALGVTTNYLSGTNNASGLTGDSDPSNDPDDALKKSMLVQGKVFKSGSNYLPDGCTGSDCNLLANDVGLPITSDMLFGALRKSSHFRTDINSMLDRMVSCLRDEIAAGGSLPPYGNIPGVDTNACYGKDVNPQGYYPHYKEMIFVAAPGTVTVAIDGGAGQACAGALLFAGQRDTMTLRCPPSPGTPVSVQKRSSSTGPSAERSDKCNYLEGDNLTSFTGSGTMFSGQSQFARVSSTQPAHQDIVRCIPGTSSFASVESPALTAAGLSQLSTYDPATRTLTLGALGVNTDIDASIAKALFGCTWTRESHSVGSGLRSYFTFRILNSGEGFTFAIIDGDRNPGNICGAAQQHLGYSGNNTATSSIAYPKVGIEIDTTQTVAQQGAFNPGAASTLANGRSDPSYTGGHVGIVYWGGENPIATGNVITSCSAPKYWSAGACYLPAEEDDNVHGRLTPPDTSARPPPRNPEAAATPPAPPTGVYKLDPGLSQIPTNKDIHVRVEMSKVTLALGSLASVRVATQTNISLATPGASLDGIAMANGDRVLVMAQSTPADNGIYSWNGAAVAMTRTADANTAASMLDALTQVTAGTHAGTSWRQTAMIAVLGTDTITWARYNSQNVNRYLVEAWILADSVTVSNQVAAMKNTTRPMSQLYSTFTPHLRDSPLVYDIQGGACPCGASQTCGADNMCYTRVFQNARLGFTNSQSTAAKDQIINITNFATTWLP